MSIRATRVVKFIRKGDKGSDAVRYWLIPSVSTVVLSNIESGDGKPNPSTVSCRVVKQVGEDSPTTITTPSNEGLSVSYCKINSTVVANLVSTYRGENISVPTNTDFTAIEFYLYRGSQLIDTATIAITRDGEQGIPGEDGVTYSVILSPASVYVDVNGKTDIANISATAYKTVGKNRAVATDGTMFLRFTKSDGAESRVNSSGLITNGAIAYQSVAFEYQVNNVVVATAALQINRQGQTGGKGDRGPALRGPQAWSDCATNYGFQAGGEGEAWKDVVMYGDNYYSCIKSHTKTTSNYPGSTADQNNKYWQLGDKIELVATKILLATYALVKNLGVESIDMKDANGNILFRAKDGNVTCKTGTFDGITVRNAEIESGRIAGFKISGTGLTNDPFTNDAYVIFRNDAHNCFAGIGGNVLPITSGSRAVARFENDDELDQWGLGRNIALLLSAKNGGYNHAFLGTGNGTLNGMIAGHKFSKFTCSVANTIYNGYVTLKENNYWCIYSGVSGSGITLPTLTEVRRALSISDSTPFCVLFTVLADLNTTNFYIYGRNKLNDSSKNTPWNTSELPLITHWNNSYNDRIELGPGDCHSFLLIYDPTKTSGTLNGYALTYTARRIHEQS